MHDYFYGVQSEQFSFIRIPTLLFTDDQYKYVSADAKILYGILLARMDLSAKNGWIDDQGRVYIICTLSEIMEKLNCADNKATKLMNELEDKCGLIERKRQGLGKPNLIYVKNFLPVDNPVESRFKIRENHDSGVAEITIQDSSKSRPSNKEDKYIDFRYTENPIYPGWDADGMSDYERYKDYFRTELELDILILDHPTEKETLEGILDTQAAPSLSQAQRLKKLSQEGGCALEDMCEILGEVKKGDLERVAFKSEQLRKYFPKSYSPKQMQDTIIKLLEQWKKKRQRGMEL